MKRFQGIFYHVNMAHVITLEKCPFVSKMYLLAAMLDPNYLLYWIDAELDATDDSKVILKLKMKGKLK